MYTRNALTHITHTHTHTNIYETVLAIRDHFMGLADIAFFA